ncbi:hypothetical protein D3C72_1904710 [compost metagenome]
MPDEVEHDVSPVLATPGSQLLVHILTPITDRQFGTHRESDLRFDFIRYRGGNPGPDRREVLNGDMP